MLFRSLEDVDLNGTRTWHGPISVQANTPLSRAKAQPMTMAELAQASAAAPVGTAEGDNIRESVARPVLSRDTQQIGFRLAAQAAVKILVDHEGWYRVTQPQLAAAGLQPNLDSRSLHLFAEGVEQPIRITGPGAGFGPASAIEFYGTAIDTPYSGQRVYWLTTGDGPGQRIAETSAAGSHGPAEAIFIQTVELKPRTTYFAALLNPNTDNFFGPLISPTAAVLNVQTSHVAPGTSTFQVVLQGVTDGQTHEVTVSINGETLGDVNFEGQQLGRAAFTIQNGVLKNGSNTITLTSQLGANDLSLVDFIDVSFPRTLTADAEYLKFTAEGGESVTVGGCSHSRSRRIDFNGPARPTWIRCCSSAMR